MSNINITETNSLGTDGYTLEKKLITLSSAKRNTIKINDVCSEQNVYKTSNYIKTNNLLSYPVKSVALVAVEYIPEHFTNKNCFTYILTINGKDFEIVPINSHKNGIKVIKTSEVQIDTYYSVYVNEPITSAILTIKINSPNTAESPFVSHIKLLTGERFANV